MQLYRNISKSLLSSCSVFKSVPVAGVKSFSAPTKLDIEYPNRNKLRVVPRVPILPPQVGSYRMQKKLRLMRGPEEYHNTLLHKQYGIVATSGGRFRYQNFEMIRMTILKNVDYTKVFAIWRIPTPWQPITKKTQGMRMGSGKGSIDHYVTPVKAGQIIVEVGGTIEYFEVKPILINIAKRLPCHAMAVSQEMMDEMAEKKKIMEETNLNPWTWKYIIQNNMLGCHKWISKYDRRWFNEYL
ncbi:hypothetical protein E2986_01709 [Frieseomelitta varia]|uniref:Large ribosomal subunit protein uL16m n=1 Tax=Frieseomelitta varia TaxID=561572 RepID=A0A833VZ87_9HYME|nr:39S ribosomal protein L16, mitochondrial [Frieseomelitta varia]KAF3425924.1 hypothetical protein E2986_01709 [Frieseomelitta varia]